MTNSLDLSNVFNLIQLSHDRISAGKGKACMLMLSVHAYYSTGVCSSGYSCQSFLLVSLRQASACSKSCHMGPKANFKAPSVSVKV